MVVGVCKITLSIDGAQSLKEKRSILRHIKDKVSNKFGCAIAEVAEQDMLQSAELGFAVVSNELGFTQSVVHKILVFIENLAAAKIVADEQDFINYGDEGLEAGKGHWEPEEDSPVLTPPRKPSKKAPTDEGALPDWLPARFMETPDPKGTKDPKDEGK